MKFVEQTLFVTNGELEKHNTLRGLTRITLISNIVTFKDQLYKQAKGPAGLSYTRVCRGGVSTFQGIYKVSPLD